MPEPAAAASWRRRRSMRNRVASPDGPDGLSAYPQHLLLVCRHALWNGHDRSGNSRWRRGLLAALAKATSSDSAERATGTAKANSLIKAIGHTWTDFFEAPSAKVMNNESKPKPMPANPARTRPAPNETFPTRLTLWDQIGFLHVHSSELRDHEREMVHALVGSMTVPWERDIRAIILRACRRLEKGRPAGTDRYGRSTGLPADGAMNPLSRLTTSTCKTGALGPVGDNLLPKSIWSAT